MTEYDIEVSLVQLFETRGLELLVTVASDDKVLMVGRKMYTYVTTFMLADPRTSKEVAALIQKESAKFVQEVLAACEVQYGS